MGVGMPRAWGRCGGMQVGVGQSKQRCACKSGRGRSLAREVPPVWVWGQIKDPQEVERHGESAARLSLDMVPKEGWRVQTAVTRTGSSSGETP